MTSWISFNSSEYFEERKLKKRNKPLRLRGKWDNRKLFYKRFQWHCFTAGFGWQVFERLEPCAV